VPRPAGSPGLGLAPHPSTAGHLLKPGDALRRGWSVSSVLVIEVDEPTVTNIEHWSRCGLLWCCCVPTDVRTTTTPRRHRDLATPRRRSMLGCKRAALIGCCRRVRRGPPRGRRDAARLDAAREPSAPARVSSAAQYAAD